MQQYIITTMLMVFYIVSVLFLLFVWCPCMAINISVQYSADPMLLRSGNPFKRHEEVLYLQPMIPPKRFDIFLPDWGMLRRSRRVLNFLLNSSSVLTGRS